MINNEMWMKFRQAAQHDGMLFERVIQDLYSKQLPTSAIAIDGGANIGFHTLGLAARLQQGRVLAVEANTETYLDLVKRTSAVPSVETIHAALQDQEERLEILFNRSTSHPGRSGVSRLWESMPSADVKYAAPEPVRATTIDKLLRERGLSRLDFVKLDLEGGEYQALRGASHALKTYRPIVVSEHASQSPQLNNYKIEDHFDWIASLNYVALAPDGRVVDRTNKFPFWYIFLLPRERLDDWSKLIVEAVLRNTPLDGNPVR